MSEFHTTDLSVEGVRAHMRKQFGLDETDKTLFPRRKTLIGTLSLGQWMTIEAALKNTQSTIGVSDGK